jgi:predicted ATP-binding protein involved in virulence
MYIDFIRKENFRNFRESKIRFVHREPSKEPDSLPRPRLPNVNLLLGDNGLGKTSMLKAIALAALGPAVGDSGIYAYRLVRREPEASSWSQPQEATIEAWFTPHEQDRVHGADRLRSRVNVTRKGDLETLRWSGEEDEPWDPIFKSSSDAFFFVGYGATRRVESRTQVDMGSRRISAFARAQRVNSLFEEAYSLVPLEVWLPEIQEDSQRFGQVVGLINELLGEESYQFCGQMEDGEYVFDRQGLRVPFPALSDGYRAFLGWVGDLLYHVCTTCPQGRDLLDNRGIVMVDEIDLHLHPKWQMTILHTLGRALPNIQFIVTSHSPLIVGSLEWMNIIVMEPQPGQASRATRIEQAVYGLDADQVLLTEYFGMESTRAPEKRRELRELTLRAREGDTEAAKELLQQMSRGMEDLP